MDDCFFPLIYYVPIPFVVCDNITGFWKGILKGNVFSALP